jgi:hypothetical protein
MIMSPKRGLSILQDGCVCHTLGAVVSLALRDGAVNAAFGMRKMEDRHVLV